MNHIFRRLFLYRLYHESKNGFMLVCIFIFLYGLLFYKKMDMLIFPYNAMFAGAPSQKINTDFYVVSVNGKIAPITKQFYWKKDMLEQSANHYAVYKKNGENVYLHEYILNKHWPASVKENCINKLTPGHVTFHYWANWYLSIAGYHVQDGDSVALCSLKPIMIHDEIKFSEMKVIEQYKWKK